MYEEIQERKGVVTNTNVTDFRYYNILLLYVRFYQRIISRSLQTLHQLDNRAKERANFRKID